MARSLIKVVSQLKFGEHVCLFYEAPEKAFTAVLPFLRLGLESNDKCLYIAEEDTVAEVEAALAKHGVDVESAVSSGQLSVITSGQAYIKEGHFDPDRIMALLREATDAALRESYRGLRVAAEMIGMPSSLLGVDRLIEYEAKLNRFLPGSQAMVICLYNHHRLPAEVLLQALKTHPLIIYEDMVGDNRFLYCVSSEIVLSGAKEDPDARFEIRLERFRMVEQLEDRNRELEAIAAVSTAVTQSLDLHEVMELAADKILKVTGLGGVWIYLVDEATRELVLKAQRGFSSAVLEEVGRLKIGQSVSGLVAQTGEPILVRDIASDPRVTTEAPKSEGWKAIACVPLKHAGKILGVLGATNYAAGSLDEHDLDMLQNIGNAISLAIRNAQLCGAFQELAVTDELTRLYNARHLRVELERELSRAKRTGTPLSLIMCDVDSFKAVNDRFGHAAGDKVLKDIANLLRDGTRLSDLVARYGGDEFVILLPGAMPSKALQVTQRITSLLASYRLRVNEEEIPISLSMGIAVYPQEASNPEELLHCADQAMYRAKRGQSRIMLYSDMGME